MKKFALYFLCFLAILAVVFFVGPRPANDETIHFDAGKIGSDLDAYLKESEAIIANLTPGAEKEIIWADPENKTKTPLAFIYIHGFFATKMEIRPVPENVASSFGANLYFTRLTGHGTGGEGLGQARMNDWVNDLAEAIAIGEQLGEKIILISTSTGGSLSILGTKFPKLMEKVAGLVLLSPNFGIPGASIALMNMPWGEIILPLMVGSERSWEAQNAEQEKWWTTSYPTQAVFTMAALLKRVEDIDKSAIKLPALFIYSNNDNVVLPKVTEKVIEEWGGETSVIIVETPKETSNHVITGDILNPTMTKLISDRITEWISGTLSP